MATYWENSCSLGLRYVSWYKYLIVSLVFSHFGFWSGNLFLIAPFPDLCLLVPFHDPSSFVIDLHWENTRPRASINKYLPYRLIMGKVFSKTTEARACIFSMLHCLVVPYINLTNHAPGSKLTKHLG